MNLTHFAAELLENFHRGENQIPGFALQVFEKFAGQSDPDPANIAIERGGVIGYGSEG